MTNNEGLKLVCMGADYELMKLKDIVNRIIVDSANQIFKELFMDGYCREKLIERYEERNGRLMNEDKETLLKMSHQSISNILPTMRPRRYDFNVQFCRIAAQKA